MLLIRSYLKNILESYIKDPNSAAVALAVTLGEKQYLNSEIKSLYTGLGVAHILAVSGLHVSIFVLILSLLLNKIAYIIEAGASRMTLFDSKALVTIKSSIISIILLFAIWFYAFLAGLSPSIVRSAIMFSVFQISSIFKRKGNIYSSLALSAVIMLLINPLIIYNVGFQLSFLAVLSIVYFYPKLKSCLVRYHTSFLTSTSANFPFFMVAEALESTRFAPAVMVSNGVYKNIIILVKRVLGYLCDIALVSISAQILTLPILAYYFKKFSIYFVVANCIIIPVIFWVILLSLVLICISSFPSIAGVVGYIISKIIVISTLILKYISKWPYSDIYISFDIMDVFGYYSILFMLILLLKFKKFVYLILLNITVLIYSILKTIYYLHRV